MISSFDMTDAYRYSITLNDFLFAFARLFDIYSVILADERPLCQFFYKRMIQNLLKNFSTHRMETDSFCQLETTLALNVENVK